MTASCKRYVLSLLAFIAVIAFSLEAAASVKIGNLYYNLNDTDHTASVTSGAKASDLSENLIIPSSVEVDNNVYDVTSIEANAFSGISKFSYLEIPASVTSIGNNAFSGCTHLLKVKFVDSDSPLVTDGEIFGKNATIEYLELGRYLQPNAKTEPSQFYESQLKDIVFSPCIKKIPRSLFSYCRNLYKVTIPEGIVELEDFCFTYCTELKELNFPSTLEKIGEYSFNYSGAIENVCSYALVPPTMSGSNAFYDVLHNTEKPTLHVLPEAVDAYSVVFPWKDFGKIVGDLQGQSKESAVLAAEGYGSLLIGESTVHNASQSVEIAVNGGEIEVKAVPDHGYEFKSLAVTLADGTTVHYSFRHEGGDIIATIPFTSGMKITARFAQPAVHTLTVGTGDGSKYNVKVGAGKAYSLDYTAPNGYTVNSVTFAGELLQVPGLSTQTVNIQTPQLTEDAAMNIAIAAIVTGVSSDNVAAPSVIVKDDTIVMSGLKCGETVTVSTLSGVSQTYSAQGDVLTITSIEEGVYVIVTARGTFKVRI